MQGIGLSIYHLINLIIASPFYYKRHILLVSSDRVHAVRQNA